MDAITTQDLLTIPGILALVVLVMQLTKQYLPSDWVPVFAIGLAIIVAVGASILVGQASAGELVDALLRGLVAALAAVGTFQAVKPLGLLQTRTQQIASKTAPRG